MGCARLAIRLRVPKKTGFERSKGNSFAAGVIAFCSEMKTNELTPKQISSVPCPTCEVAAGQRWCCFQALRVKNHT